MLAFNFLAANSTSISRIVAAANRIAFPDSSIELLPEVIPSLGLKIVSGLTITIRLRSRSSSSETILAIAVEIFWPISTFPMRTLIRPSLENEIQESISGFFKRLGFLVISPMTRSQIINCFQNSGMGTATTEMFLESFQNILFFRIRFFIEKCCGCNDHSRSAVPALCSCFR